VLLLLMGRRLMKGVVDIYVDTYVPGFKAADMKAPAPEVWEG